MMPHTPLLISSKQKSVEDLPRSVAMSAEEDRTPDVLSIPSKSAGRHVGVASQQVGKWVWQVRREACGCGKSGGRHGGVANQDVGVVSQEVGLVAEL